MTERPAEKVRMWKKQRRDLIWCFVIVALATYAPIQDFVIDRAISRFNSFLLVFGVTCIVWLMFRYRYWRRRYLGDG